MRTIIKAGAKTPKISFDKKKAILYINGRLIPENPEEIFSTIDSLIEESIDICEIISLDIELEYFNTGATRFLYNSLLRFKKLGSNRVIWHYEKDDEDILESGKEFAEMTNLDFDFVVIPV